MSKTNYNLTFWQKIQLPLLWCYWKLSAIENKKSWHEVKKGMERHEHKFTRPFTQQGYKFMQCEHEGCSLCEPLEEKPTFKFTGGFKRPERANENQNRYDHSPTITFRLDSGDNRAFLKASQNDKQVVICNNCKNAIDFELWCNTDNCPYCLASTAFH